MLGKKVLDLGGNAVLGFRQCFDLEEEKKSISVRSIGTAVKLIQNNHQLIGQIQQLGAYSPYSPYSPGVGLGSGCSGGGLGTPDRISPKDIDPFPPIDLDDPILTNSPNPNPLPSHQLVRPLDPVFLTLTLFPDHFITTTGGFVCATSIKLIENDDREIRETWWTEVRDEIKSHARTVGCSHVVGYTESTSISEEQALIHFLTLVALLYCSGTAVNIDSMTLNANASMGVNATALAAVKKAGNSRASVYQNQNQSQNQSQSVQTPNTSVPVLDYGGSPDTPGKGRAKIVNGNNQNNQNLDELEEAITTTPTAANVHGINIIGENSAPAIETSNSGKKKKYNCRACHVSYKRQESPFPMALTRCSGCRKKFVPEVFLSTTEPPAELELLGSGVLIEAHVCRPRKNKGVDSRATVVSESIPFAQYDIHRQLMYKLRIYGLNAIFGLKIQFSLGLNLLTAVATGTAVYLRVLPTPPALKVFRTLEVIDDEDKQLLETQRKLMIKSENNRRKIEAALLDFPDSPGGDSDSNNEDSELEAEDLGAPVVQSRLQQRAMIVEIDDEQDEDLVLFLDDVWNDNFQMCNIEFPKGLKQESEGQMNHFQMVKMFRQSSIDVSHHPNRQLASIFKSMYLELRIQTQCLSFCRVSGLLYYVDILKDNIVQVYMTAMIHGKLEENDFALLNIDMDLEDVVVEDDVNISATPGSVTQETKPGFFETMFALGGMQPQSQYTVEDGDDGEDNYESDEGEIDAEINDVLVEGGEPRTSIPSINDQRTSFLNRYDTSLDLVELSQLSFVPRATHKRYLGRICHTFIKESNLVIGNSGMGGFCHIFMTETLAIVKAHVLGLGGNAVVGFNVDQIRLDDTLKNQGYALISVSGDVCEVEYTEGDLLR